MQIRKQFVFRVSTEQKKIVCLIFLFSIFYFLIFSTTVWAATIFVGPSTIAAKLQEEVPFEIWIDTEGLVINAVDLKLSFQPGIFQGDRIDFGNSILTLFPEAPTFSRDGTLKVVAGTPNGFQGRVPLVRVFARAAGTGEVMLVIDPSSRVFLNDALGTAVRPRMLANFIQIRPSLPSSFSVTSTSHPDEERWYPRSELFFSLKKAEGDKLSVLVTQNPTAEPDSIAEEQTSFTFSHLDDGVWYIIVRKLNCNSVQENCVIRRRVMIDTTPPETFVPVLARSNDAFEQKYFVSFNAEDKQSGVDKYLVREFPFFGFREVKNPYVLRSQLLGWSVTIRALDGAGNIRDVTIAHPRQIVLGTIVVVIVFLLVLWWMLKMVIWKIRKII